jgi:type IV secretory pathway protease TraF
VPLTKKIKIMKKIILAAFIAFSIVSCSDDNDTPAPTTTSVTAEFGNSFLQPKTTGKNVERGSIPVAIDKITVTATNISTPSVPLSPTVFDLVANGTAGAEKKFLIEKIASGTNSFTATATTNGSKVSSSTIYTTDALGLNAFNANKTATPYAEYEATTSATIVLTTPQTVAFNMATAQGKLNTYIYTDATVTNSNRKVTVQGTSHKADGTVITTSTAFDITGSKSLVFVWSNELAVVGSYVVYEMKVYDALGNTVESTFTERITVKASTTINTTTVVTATGLTTSANEATFTFPIWQTEG